MEKYNLSELKIEKGLFGVKYLYLDAKTRVRYGFNFWCLGITYTLERKRFFWNEVAWTYPRTHRYHKLEDIIHYLKWYEEDEKKPKTKCLF